MIYDSVDLSMETNGTIIDPEMDQPRIFVFDSPRTCSQVFNKLFAVHPQLSHVFHPLIGASMYGPERVTSRLKHCTAAEEAQQELANKIDLPDETYGIAASRLMKATAAIAEQGKIPFIKDHIFCVLNPHLIKANIDQGLGSSLPSVQGRENPTMLHQEFFESVAPIILIRHPALSVPSYYRAQKAVFKLNPEDEDFAAMSTLRWARIIFDAYMKLWEGVDRKGAEAKQKFPIVIDAADVVYNTERLMLRLCHALGIDSNGIQYQWNPVPLNEWPRDPIMQGFFGDMLRSNGVLKRTAKAGQPEEQNLDLDAMTVLWAEEFGPEDAKTLRKRVGEEISNYEYLVQFKMLA
ncbi:putative Sulfotransferase domain-containing protein [Seiridium unicorne]|uniref:Sulfotransferase domain-containing protein n=1 Tax=Seiridium unicorne TaxID=138068 RepID=A0ABR2ULD2_9PEZI